ncbi:MAG TPA: aminoglycoside phosphotransferase family protein [Gaiellaceae bacterium]|nr:aminoglycoside phosphotransferase family protein [Gaiellaceae bacterium]
MIEHLQARWSLTVGAPFDSVEVSCAWVAPAALAGGGTVVLKLGMPHLEGEREIDGLRFWNGDPTVRLLAADDELNAMLLERCEPGTPLRALPEPEQDIVVAGLLRRLWRPVPSPHPFRTLAEMTAAWTGATHEVADSWADAGLVEEGLRLFEELPRTAPSEVLLATDLHAGNVLRAEREPWLVIDPKPFVGDPAYDVTQHLMNCERLQSQPLALVHRLADLLGLDRERVRLWTFARAAAELQDGSGKRFLPVAKALAP